MIHKGKLSKNIPNFIGFILSIYFPKSNSIITFIPMLSHSEDFFFPKKLESPNPVHLAQWYLLHTPSKKKEIPCFLAKLGQPIIHRHYTYMC